MSPECRGLMTSSSWNWSLTAAAVKDSLSLVPSLLSASTSVDCHCLSFRSSAAILPSLFTSRGVTETLCFSSVLSFAFSSVSQILGRAKLERIKMNPRDKPYLCAAIFATASLAAHTSWMSLTALTNQRRVCRNMTNGRRESKDLSAQQNKQ